MSQHAGGDAPVPADIVFSTSHHAGNGLLRSAVCQPFSAPIITPLMK